MMGNISRTKLLYSGRHTVNSLLTVQSGTPGDYISIDYFVTIMTIQFVSICYPIWLGSVSIHSSCILTRTSVGTGNMDRIYVSLGH